MKKLALVVTSAQLAMGAAFAAGSAATLVCDPEDKFALQGTSKVNPKVVKCRVGVGEAKRNPSVKADQTFDLFVTSSGTLLRDGNEGVFEAFGPRHAGIGKAHEKALVLEVLEVSGGEVGSGW